MPVMTEAERRRLTDARIAKEEKRRAEEGSGPVGMPNALRRGTDAISHYTAGWESR